jgi:hypothetical protein
MRRFSLLAVVATLAITTACTDNTLVGPPSGAAYAFDENGYNDIANIFNGTADGVDRILGNGDMGVYGNDHLVMKWNRQWENCNANRSPANCAGAWLTNEWNGQVPDGSGETWHYKFVWNGTCAEGSTLPDGGRCTWTEYNMKMSHGPAGSHFGVFEF